MQRVLHRQLLFQADDIPEGDVRQQGPDHQEERGRPLAVCGVDVDARPLHLCQDPRQRQHAFEIARGVVQDRPAVLVGGGEVAAHLAQHPQPLGQRSVDLVVVKERIQRRRGTLIGPVIGPGP